MKNLEDLKGLEKLNFGEIILELIKKRKICEKEGHKEKEGYSSISSGIGGTKKYCHCEKCGMMYERYLTFEEWKEFSELMNTPMNI